MTEERIQEVQTAMNLLGSAWRGDWTTFDGRTLRSQLDELSVALSGVPRTFDGAIWAQEWNICSEHECWMRNCEDGHARKG